MKIAILSDIHGNIFALDAVLEKVLQAEVDRIIFLGDFTGYYYHSREVFDRLNELSATMILGNHEHMLFDCADRLEDGELFDEALSTLLLIELPTDVTLIVDAAVIDVKVEIKFCVIIEFCVVCV